jgi:hypothetical protein
MNNGNEVARQIIEWLKADGVPYRIKENDSDTFRTILRLSKNVDLNIHLTSRRPSCLTLSTNAYLAPDDQRAYFRLDREKKESFLRAVRGALLNIDVDHQINPDGDTLQSISITKTIYFDGLTMDKFFGSILLLKRAFALLEMTYCDHLRFSSSDIVSR